MKRPLDSELNALIDNRLSSQRAMEVEQWLAQHPDDAARVRDWRAQKEALHAAFDERFEAPIPERLRRAAVRSPRWQHAMAAAIVWLAVGGVTGYAVRGMLSATPGPASISSLQHQATIAHVTYSPEVRHPVEVGAEQEAHLVQWLSKRLGHPVVIPHLHAQGFDLVGGRLLPANEGPAAQFMYQDKAGQRLTLYVRQATGNAQTAFRFAQDGPVNVFYWVDGPFGYALSGTVPRERLLTVAEASYRQLAAQ